MKEEALNELIKQLESLRSSLNELTMKVGDAPLRIGDKVDARQINARAMWLRDEISEFKHLLESYRDSHAKPKIR